MTEDKPNVAIITINIKYKTCLLKDRDFHVRFLKENLPISRNDQKMKIREWKNLNRKF
jgi:hypothetical protein